MPCPKAIHHSSSSLTSNTDMQQGPKQACACVSPATRVNKPWVQKYSTRLTRPKRVKVLGMQVLGQGKDVVKIQKFFAKSLLFLFLFSSFTLNYFSSLSQTKYSYPIFQSFSFYSFFSCFSNSPVLHCFCNESSLHIHGAPAIRIDSSPSWGFLITRHM